MQPAGWAVGEAGLLLASAVLNTATVQEILFTLRGGFTGLVTEGPGAWGPLQGQTLPLYFSGKCVLQASLVHISNALFQMVPVGNMMCPALAAHKQKLPGCPRSWFPPLSHLESKGKQETEAVS